jgi:hypothetical protein
LRGLRVEHAVVSIMFVKWFVLFFWEASVCFCCRNLQHMM